MASEYLRDSAMNAVILGFFASSWFGWAQERPPAGWRPFLVAGAAISLAVAIVGGVLAWQNWSAGSALEANDAYARFGVIVGIEFGVAALGAAVLAWRGLATYTACWVCLVVGVHFWPLAPVLEDPALYALGAVLVAVSIGALLVSRRSSIDPSAITGAGAGLALLAFAGGSAIAAIA